MATEKQQDFFAQLQADKQFPSDSNPEELRQQFSQLPDKAASAWIEKAMTLPDKGHVPPPF